MTARKQTVAAYLTGLEEMRPDTIDAFLTLCADDVRFTDPFNDVTGKSALRHVFEDMFEKVSDLSFKVHDCHGAGTRWLLRWTYAGRMGSLGRASIEGMSFVELDADNLVCRHADYWDGGEIYRRVPVVGAAIRAIKRRVAARG
jgi:steroid delta-isomerase